MGAIYSHHVFVLFLPILQKGHSKGYCGAKFRGNISLPHASPCVKVSLTWSCWVSMEILFCSAICCPGLIWCIDEEEGELEVIPKGGDRAPKASFSRNTSLDSSVICLKTKIQVLPSRWHFNSSSVKWPRWILTLRSFSLTSPWESWTFLWSSWMCLDFASKSASCCCTLASWDSATWRSLLLKRASLCTWNTCGAPENHTVTTGRAVVKSPIQLSAWTDAT